MLHGRASHEEYIQDNCRCVGRAVMVMILIVQSARPLTPTTQANTIASKVMLSDDEARVHNVDRESRSGVTERASAAFRPTAQRKLLVAWLMLGLLPFSLQTRSYLKFATPHNISENLIVPIGAEQEKNKLSELCPIEGVHMGQVWWNIKATHYYSVNRGRLCHFVMPQYNAHGNYLIDTGRTNSSPTTPSSCAEDSVPFEQYFYHGSIGYFSFYEEADGTYCIKDKTAYIRVRALGTIDMNGSTLAEFTGKEGYIWSYWYCTLGVLWLVFRGLVLRRSYVSCKRHGRICDQLGEELHRQTTTVFVHESLRLSAHGASNYHHLTLLYFLAEGLMSDLFLLVANDGFFARIQYISLGYNLSGLLLLLFEIIESMRWMREKWRFFVKRLLFCYESSLLGEVLSAAGQEHIITILNRSSMRKTKATAEAVSYYLWSLVGHGIFVLSLITFMMVIRATWATVYVRWKHGCLRAIFAEPCSVDTTLALRNKMTMLGGYCWENGQLYYTTDALKAFGLLKVEEEDGSEFIVLRKVGWVKVLPHDLFVIGSVSDQRVEPCQERPCTGVVNIFERNLGGSAREAARCRGQTRTKSFSIVPSE